MLPAIRNKTIKIVALITLFLGIIVMIGWIFNIILFKKVYPNYVSMKFNTALCISFMGATLLLSQYQERKIQFSFYKLFAIILTGIGSITLLQDILGVDWKLDQFFVIDHEAIISKESFPGRMGANTAISFVLLGLAFIGLSIKRPNIILISQYFFHLVTAIVSVSLVGYLYNLSYFYNFSHVGPIAIHTAISLFLGSIAATLIYPSLGITGIFTGNQLGNQLARRLFGLSVLMVLLFGSLRVQSQHYYLFSFELGISVLTVFFLILNLSIIVYTANWLNQVDKKRLEAENEIKTLNIELEDRVNKRTSEIQEILKKLQESEAKFRILVEKSLVGVYISQDEKFTYINPRLAEIFGYQSHELIDTEISPIEMLISESERNTVRKSVQARYIGTTETDHYEVNGIKKDKSENRIEFFGARVLLDGKPSIIGTMLDVTERSKAEETLKRSEANLNTILDNTDTLYALLDKDQKIIAINQHARNFLKDQFNLSKENLDMVQIPNAEKHPPEIIEQLEKYRLERRNVFNDHLKRVLQGEKIIYEIDYLQPDGSTFWYDVRLSPIRDGEEILGLLVELTNITDRRNAQEKLKDAYERIQIQINNIQEMAWKQSHLIRGPLANLTGLVHLISKNPTEKVALQHLQSELEKIDSVLIQMSDDFADHNLQ